MLYKVGDKVKIKKREELEKYDIAVEEMLPCADTVATITYVDDWQEFYHIDIDKYNFRWDDDCFEKERWEGWKAVPNTNYVDEKFELPTNVKETIIEKASKTRQLLEEFDTLLSEFQKLRNKLYDLERNKEN